MIPTEPLPLHHSWPLFDRARHFDLGLTHDPVSLPVMVSGTAGHWQCDLADDSLTWSDAVYDLFGLPRGATLNRALSLPVYCDESRAVMERLRAYAIRHRRGFTVDLNIRPGGRLRKMRLIAAPECEDGRVVRLRGVKLGLD
ncbi:MAG: hypothetical protein ABW039_05795 [Sphingobium sp.]